MYKPGSVNILHLIDSWILSEIRSLCRTHGLTKEQLRDLQLSKEKKVEKEDKPKFKDGETRRTRISQDDCFGAKR